MIEMECKTQELFTLTGNPFVDAGLAMICAISEKTNIQEIGKNELKTIIEKVNKIYTQEKWRSAIHSQIFPNAEIFNPSIVKNNPERYKELLDEYIDTLTPLEKNGNCIICGMRNGRQQIRMRIPMLN